MNANTDVAPASVAPASAADPGADLSIIDELGRDDASVSPRVRAVERVSQRETPMEALLRGLGDFLVAFARTLLLSSLILPFILGGLLTADVPFRLFDRVATGLGTAPSAFLSWGSVLMAATPLLAILFARRFGGDEAARAVTASWAVAAIAAAAELAYLAPALEPHHFPSLRFVGAFVASSMIGAYMAAALFDILRGGGRWWRAPLYSAMGGYLAAALIYYPAAYWGAAAPVANLVVLDMGAKLVFALAFLPVYGALRKALRPKGGLGGF